MENLLTYKQAAEIMGVCERTVWGLVKSGKLQCKKIGRLVRILPSVLEAFINGESPPQPVEVKNHG
jgi:excisionase family DNA binding protein